MIAETRRRFPHSYTWVESTNETFYLLPYTFVPGRVVRKREKYVLPLALRVLRPYHQGRRDT